MESAPNFYTETFYMYLFTNLQYIQVKITVYPFCDNPTHEYVLNNSSSSIFLNIMY
jgi:hypothetical protein